MERFVAQAIKLSSNIDHDYPHKYGSSYKRVSMMSFENIHIDLSTLKKFYASYGGFQYVKNDSKLVAQAITFLSDLEIDHPYKCGSNYKRLSMMSFENIQLYLSTLKKCGLSNDTLKWCLGLNPEKFGSISKEMSWCCLKTSKQYHIDIAKINLLFNNIRCNVT